MLTLADVFEALTNRRMDKAGMVITDAMIDSRRVIPGSLFVAIPGEHVDGHDFVSNAFENGASFALIQKDLPVSAQTLDMRKTDLELNANLSTPLCLLVDNTLAALQQIARFWRRKLDIRVIGITGSVGKSTTKELISEILSVRYRTIKNLGNLNNEIGLPLTILRIGSGYERAVLEMGFYVPGEIELLCEISLPHIGVITNIGMVHAERAGSQEAIARGKAELIQSLPPEGTAILNFDDPWVRKMEADTRAHVLFYGLTSEADLWADHIESRGLDGIRFQLHYKRESLHIHAPMIGRHSVHTVLRAVAVGLVDGLTWPEIIQGIKQGHNQFRLAAVRSRNGSLILDDTYNATPESMLAALNLLDELDGRKIAVLGDMLELGPYEDEGHEMVGVRAAQVSRLLLTLGPRGHLIAKAAAKAGMQDSQIMVYEQPEPLIRWLQDNLTQTDTVLIKGSHGLHMDRITSALEIES
jgi:UDP-N-acetylmuramoyl-tripeptide--D-alanyl-D-alanine ligase